MGLVMSGSALIKVSLVKMSIKTYLIDTSQFFPGENCLKIRLGLIWGVEVGVGRNFWLLEWVRYIALILVLHWMWLVVT